jgi:hypothetical protein
MVCARGVREAAEDDEEEEGEAEVDNWAREP